MFDYHMHTIVSFDGHDRGLQMAEAAKSAGLKEICFTDHFDLHERPDEAPDIFTLEELRATYAGIDREVMIVGRAGQAEIWDVAEYEAFEAENLSPEKLLASLEAICL